MLRTLSIHNVALIDRLDIDFYDGFSVLTGETGAGKSIIIEALNFVLGERASRELIKTDTQKASVEATFQITAGEPVTAVLQELELEAEDGELVLYRELSAAGKNVCRVNGTLLSTTALKQIGDKLVDIHGQHAHQALLNEKLHIDMLDEFAGEALPPVKAAVAQAYHTAADAGRQLRAADMNEQERERRCDLLAYQMKEIDGANLTDGEEETLLEQRSVLQNAQAIMEALEGSGEALAGDEGGLTRLSGAVHAMEKIAAFHKDYQDASDRLRELYYNLEDVSYTIRDLRSGFSYEPDALDQIEQRLEAISTLKRKYGSSIGEILAYREQIGREYEDLQSSEERREALQAAYQKALETYRKASEKLSGLRKSAADSLGKRLEPELRDLGMPNAQFQVAFTLLAGETPSPSGVDGVEFLLSTNRGEPVKPLSKVASGGELSRVMLSFKSALAATGGIPTMVFDEIDTGISGQIGTAVAVKMRQISRGHQVLCITHLPQIAAYANRQYLVYKEDDGGRASSHAKLLDEKARAGEIARIMGSRPDDKVAMQHAKQLIAAANAHVES